MYNCFKVGIVNGISKMALYELLVRQQYYAQEIINRFHYQSDSDAGFTLPANAMATAFGANSLDTGEFDAETVMGKIQAVVNAGLSFLEVQVKNLYSATDFFTVAYNPAPVGLFTGGGDNASPALAYGFVSNRTTLAVRAGHKRFAGVAEGAMSPGGVVPTGFSQAVTLADALGEVLSYVDGLATRHYAPVVLAFQKYTTPSGKFAYKPYDTEAEQIDHMAVGITYQVMTDVRTQRSRQYGRGR
jgi:hypothetical protein